MNKIKSTKGITLISLVVTIIILLILAGVTIATLMGENGIIKRAGQAKEEYEKATRFQKHYPVIHFFYYVALKIC